MNKRNNLPSLSISPGNLHRKGGRVEHDGAVEKLQLFWRALCRRKMIPTDHLRQAELNLLVGEAHADACKK